VTRTGRSASSVALVLAVSLCAAALAPGALAASPSAWTERPLGVPPAQTFVGPVACASTEVCLAAASGVLAWSLDRTADGGKLWTGTRFAFPGDAGAEATGLSCPTATVCVAATNGPGPAPFGAKVFWSSNAGASWTSPGSPRVPRPGFLEGMACPSATTCLTLEGGDSPAIYRTGDRGTSWQQSTLEGGGWSGAALWRVSCVRQSTCVAVGSLASGASLVARTTDGGRGWKLRTVPNAGSLSDVSCDPGGTCVALATGGTSVLVSGDGGASWSSVAIGSSMAAGGVQCVSGGSCLVAGAVSGSAPAAASTTDGGATWTVTPAASVSGPLGPLACSGSSLCVAARGPESTSEPPAPATFGFALTTDLGARWSAAPVPTGADVVSALTCPTPGECFASAGLDGARFIGEVLESTSSGARWRVSLAIPGLSDLSDVSCVSASTCLAVGPGPNAGGTGPATIAWTTDGGSHWSTERPAGAIGTLRSVSCGSSSCAVVAGTSSGPVLLSVVPGQAATVAYHAPGSVESLNGLSCSGPQLCLAVGARSGEGAVVVRSESGGTQWTLLPRQSSLPFMSAVTCVSSTACYGTDGGASPVVVTANAGSAWTSEKVVGSAQGAALLTPHIACSGPDTCVLVGYGSSPFDPDAAAAVTTDGTTWRLRPVGLQDVGMLLGVAISGSTVIAGGFDGTVVTGSLSALG